jgi:hypothetical protein
MIRTLPEDRFVLDGELIVPVDGVGSFDALQQPAPAESRIRKLSATTPAHACLVRPAARGQGALARSPSERAPRCKGRPDA